MRELKVRDFIPDFVVGWRADPSCLSAASGTGGLNVFALH